jgi:hypothetical protein
MHKYACVFMYSYFMSVYVYMNQYIYMSRITRLEAEMVKEIDSSGIYA